MPVRAHDVHDAVRDRGPPASVDRDRRRPGPAAVARVARLDRLAGEVHVRHVAAAEEAARAPVVADDPLLVVVLGRAARSVDRAAPAQTVTRAIDDHRHRGEVRAERRGEPPPVPGVVGDHGVAHPVERPGRQEARAPRAAAVPRGGEAVPRGAAVEVPTRLEDRDDRRAEREAVGLDLRFVLRREPDSGVARDLAAHDLAVQADHVDDVGVDDVAAASARHVVHLEIAARDQTVGARAAEQPIAARPGVEEVVRGAPLDPVSPAEAVEVVRLQRPVEPVRARGAEDDGAAGRSDPAQPDSDEQRRDQKTTHAPSLRLSARCVQCSRSTARTCEAYEISCSRSLTSSSRRWCS